LFNFYVVDILHSIVSVSDNGWSKSEPIVYYDNPFPAKIPINYHIGCMGLPPSSHEFVDSIPPMVTGGNLDNKRIGIGTTMYYPVQVAGALLSMGDAHTAQVRRYQSVVCLELTMVIITNTLSFNLGRLGARRNGH
jgi:acetamidase/formamidase